MTPGRALARPGRGSLLPRVATPGRGSLRPPAPSRCSARKLAARSFPGRPPAEGASPVADFPKDLSGVRDDSLARSGHSEDTNSRGRETHSVFERSQGGKHVRGGSPRKGARSELASGAATGGGGPQAPPTRTSSDTGPQAPPTRTSSQPGPNTSYWKLMRSVRLRVTAALRRGSLVGFAFSSVSSW